MSTSGNRSRPGVRSQEAQRLASLELANQIRFARANLKQQIAAGHIDVVALVQQPPAFVESMQVTKLLGAIHGVGPSRVRKVLRRAELSDGKTLGGLTDRQRARLAETLVAQVG